MINLDFYGPVHFDEVDQTTGNLKQSNGKPKQPSSSGIYVWGFMYWKNKHGGLNGPVNFSRSKIVYDKKSMQFIPYYLGKSQKNMFTDRLIKHHDVRNAYNFNSHADKYMRLSHGYMMSFFNDPLFPIKTGRSNASYLNLAKMKPGQITYHNDPLVLSEIYPTLKISRVITDHPITEQKISGIPIQDTLEDLVISMNNFWFCYAAQDTVTKALLEHCENYSFYSLKGKTVSKTKNCPDPDSSLSINDHTSSKIFKYVGKRITPTSCFPGY